MLHAPKMLHAEDRIEKGPRHGYFYTGDIFFEAQAYHAAVPERAFAVITPACDLVRPKAGRSILICEGAVAPLTPHASLVAEDGLPLAVVPHPRDSTSYLTIEWDKKKLHVWDDKMKNRFKEGAPYIRASRLRPEYALQLQHAVTADLSRVGTLKPPSSLAAHGLRCFVRDNKHWHEVFYDRSRDAAALSDSEVPPDKKFTTFMISDPALHRALSAVQGWLETHPGVATRAGIERTLADDSREQLRSFRQNVPTKGTAGGGLDITAYPLQSAGGPHQKAVGLVRSANCASDYARVANGQGVNNRQTACVVFRWEVSVVDAPPAADVDGQEAEIPAT